MLKVNENILISEEEMSRLFEALNGALEFYRYYDEPIKKRCNTKKLRRMTRHALNILEGKIKYDFDEDND